MQPNDIEVGMNVVYAPSFKAKNVVAIPLIGVVEGIDPDVKSYCV